eukprot:s43_g42.t1
MFVQMIRQYDAGSLAHAEQKLEEELRKLTEDTVHNLQKAAGEMQVVIRQLAMSAVQAASRGFRESSEAFQKFLNNTAQMEEDLYTDQESVQEFKRYVQKWFDIFALSLLDPQVFTKPLVQGRSLVEALDACSTLTEISDLCKLWLKLVSTITLEYRTTQLQNRAQSIILMDAEGRPAGPSTATESLASYACHVFGDSEGSEISALVTDPNRLRCGISWIHFGWTGVGLNDSKLPATYQCCILTFKVLSARHVLFLATFFFNLLFIAFEIVILKPFLLALFVINEVCVVCVLICFDQIDATQRAKHLAERAQRKKEQLEAKFGKARQEWDEVQGMLDLWNFRTYPFMSLLNKLQIAMDNQNLKDLRDQRADPVVRVRWMRTINDGISSIDVCLQEQVDWTSIDEAASQQRRQTGQAFNRYIEQVFSAGIHTTLQNVLGHLTLDKLQPALGEQSPSRHALRVVGATAAVQPVLVPQPSMQPAEQPAVLPAVQPAVQAAVQAAAVQPALASPSGLLRTSPVPSTTFGQPADSRV